MDWWAETDRIPCTNRHGEPVEVIVRQWLNERGEGLIFGPPAYSIETGELLEKIDGGCFRSASGEVLTRLRTG